ncbi:MAG: acyl-CoA dehydrogenase family protein [Xanthomonadaceae bacterium]|nr:acyl-CoA dehydrogenase family protein [Xanthomonadaceae bacterium]
MNALEPFQTHVVENQAPPYAPENLYVQDVALREAVQREGGQWAAPALTAYGAAMAQEGIALGVDANRFRPQLRTHDRYGNRVDEAEFHPSYHRLMTLGVERGVHAFAWRDPRPGAHVARAALSYLHHQAEQGTSCPLTMSYAAYPVLAAADGIEPAWLTKAIAPHYDPRNRPMTEKAGVTFGMGMTEKQGGSDVRSNSTRATPGSDGSYALIGHKWFMSAPMSDAFLVLAQAPGGLTCFLLPRWRPDGSANALRIMRLKDKLGNWSNASSEVEFCNAFAQRIGDEGRGVATIIEMVALTRLECLIGSAAEMRMALAQATHHARHRIAFGKRLFDQPLMRNVLADLALESEAAMALAMRVARAVDASGRDPREAAFARVATAIGKYWVCKRAPAFVNEAQECLGGAGYVEEAMLARLYREAPLNSIWEGCGNIQCLDVLRALVREPETGDALLAELSGVAGSNSALDAEREALAGLLAEPRQLEPVARAVVERLALALQAAVLLRSGSPLAATFCHSRLGGGRGQAFGTLAPGFDWDAIAVRMP